MLTQQMEHAAYFKITTARLAALVAIFRSNRTLATRSICTPQPRQRRIERLARISPTPGPAVVFSYAKANAVEPGME